MSTTPPVGVAWTRVGWFYGIALGGAVLAGSLLWILRQAGAPIAVILGGMALLYMPLPLVAGLIVERRAGRRTLAAIEWRRLRTRFWSTAGPSAVSAVAVTLAVLVLCVAVMLVAGGLGLPGAGHFVADDAEFRQRLLQLVPDLPADTELPPVPVLAVVLLLEGLLAGLTINGLFCLGEEYGWRGVLAQELRPLGTVRANLLTGLLWGLWHSPAIILLGHNYGTEWGWGILLMVAWTTPLSFLLSWVRVRSGSVLAPAFLHGALNGTIGAFVLTIIGGSVFVALPVGLLMSLVLSVVAVLVWRLPLRALPDARTTNFEFPTPDYAAEGVREAESRSGPRPS